MNRPECYRDSDRWRRTCRAQKDRYYGKSRDRARSGRRWTEDEVELALDMTLTDSQIAERLQRSVMAVQHKRNEIKRSYVSEGLEWPFGKGRGRDGE